MHETLLANHHDNVTRAPIDLRCGYCYNIANVPLVPLLVRHAYGPSTLLSRWFTWSHGGEFAQNLEHLKQLECYFVVFACNRCMARMLPGEAELVSE